MKIYSFPTATRIEFLLATMKNVCWLHCVNRWHCGRAVMTEQLLPKYSYCPSAGPHRGTWAVQANGTQLCEMFAKEEFVEELVEILNTRPTAQGDVEKLPALKEIQALVTTTNSHTDFRMENGAGRYMNDNAWKLYGYAYRLAEQLRQGEGDG